MDRTIREVIEKLRPAGNRRASLAVRGFDAEVPVNTNLDNTIVGAEAEPMNDDNSEAGSEGGLVEINPLLRKDVGERN